MKILNYKLFTENKDYEETYWMDEVDGEEVKVTIHEVQDYLKSVNAPTIEIPVDEIYHMCCHEGKTDKDTIERSERSDLNFPIIIAKGLSGNWSMILDGHHRIFKAHNHGIEKINAIVLDLKKSPKIYQNLFDR